MMKGDDHRLREGEGGSGWRYSNEAIFSTISSFGFLVLLCSNCPYFRTMCVLSRVLICCCCSCAPFRWWLTSFGSGIGEVNFLKRGVLSLLHPLFPWSVTSPSSPSCEYLLPFLSLPPPYSRRPVSLSIHELYPTPIRPLFFFSYYLFPWSRIGTYSNIHGSYSVCRYFFVLFIFPLELNKQTHRTDLKLASLFLAYFFGSVSNNENGVFSLVLHFGFVSVKMASR